MNILYVNNYAGPVGGAEVAIRNAMKQSRHHIELKLTQSIQRSDLQGYDLIHLHNVSRLKPQTVRGFNTVVSVHDYQLYCPNPIGWCHVFKTNCLRCMGLVNYLHKYVKRHRPLKRIVEESNDTIVHSRYMRNLYTRYNPTYLPIPLEVDECHPAKTREEYLFYSGRCHPEKNPRGFAKLCHTLNTRGIMALEQPTNKEVYKSTIRTLKDAPVEIILSPERKELFDLYRHAHLTVHPYLYAEPFGIANVNSVLNGTPLFTYPYGNQINTATWISSDFNDLTANVRRAIEDPEFYQHLLSLVNDQRINFSKEHDSIETWDDYYEGRQ